MTADRITFIVFDAAVTGIVVSNLKLGMWDPRPVLNMSVKGHLPTGSGTSETGSKVLHCPIGHEN